MLDPICIQVTAGNIATADAFGEFIAAASRDAGFKDVTIDTATQCDYDTTKAVEAMRALNPEMFSTPIRIMTDEVDKTPASPDDEEGPPF